MAKDKTAETYAYAYGFMSQTIGYVINDLERLGNELAELGQVNIGNDVFHVHRRLTNALNLTAERLANDLQRSEADGRHDA